MIDVTLIAARTSTDGDRIEVGTRADDNTNAFCKAKRMTLPFWSKFGNHVVNLALPDGLITDE